ncbi:Rz1-like lysis system protein LysC [Klebsiella pneumoniae]|uniref:Rz1-like lysis system protein LysC n=1 Tax=Klebsiella pneumoniae TaxID=573 RepID=UPI003F7FEA06
MTLIASCSSTPPAPRVELVRVRLPDSLLNPLAVPPLPAPLTWGGLAVWGDQLLDVVETCNADRAAIRQINATGGNDGAQD